MAKNPKQLHVNTPSGKVSAKKAALDKRLNTGQATGRLESRSADIMDMAGIGSVVGIAAGMVKGVSKMAAKKATGTVVGKGGKIASKTPNTVFATKKAVSPKPSQQVYGRVRDLPKTPFTKTANSVEKDLTRAGHLSKFIAKEGNIEKVRGFGTAPSGIIQDGTKRLEGIAKYKTTFRDSFHNSHTTITKKK